MANRLERVIQILVLLQSGIPFNAVQLAQELRVHRRTVFRDIALLRQIGLAISFDEGTARYWIPADLRVPNEGLTTDELSALVLAAHLTCLQPSQEQIDLAKRAAVKLSKQLPKQKRSEMGRILRAIEREPAAAEPVGQEVFGTLLEAIRKHEAVKLSFKSERGAPVRTIKVDIQRLIVTQDGWYLVGRQIPGRGVRRIQLSEIEKAEVLEGTFASTARFRATAGIETRPPRMARGDELVKRKNLVADPQVTFRNCRGISATGTLLRLSRSAIVFEVYNPYSIVQNSEVLSNLRVVRGERVIYEGRAVVTNLVGTGLMLIVSASLVDPWCDLAELKPGPLLKEEVGEFIDQWKDSHEVLQPSYKNCVTAVRNFLVELNRWLEQGETVAGLREDESRKAMQNEFAADVEETVYPKLSDLFACFEEECKSVPRKLVPVHKGFARGELHPLILCSPYVHRTFTKPLGYAGDYQMVNMILAEPLQGETTFARIVNAIPLRVNTAQAHRNRIQILTDVLAREAELAAGQERPFRALNIGCGPAIEVQRFIRDTPLANRTTFTLVDFNEETLAYTKSEISSVVARHSRSPEVIYIHQSIHDLLREATEGKSTLTGEFDLVYCAGLFDYLSDLVCSTLVDLFFQQTARGGLMLLTNVHTCHPAKGFMEHLLEWSLTLRDENNMSQLGNIAARRSVYRDSTGANVFLEVRKPLE